jgi:hypothetical protein
MPERRGQYQLSGEPRLVSLCHCKDCRRGSGAPVMAWAEFTEDSLVASSGIPKTIKSSGAAMRSFCPECGTTLFHRNQDILPDIVEVSLASFDPDGSLPPTIQIVTAERLGWMRHVNEIPAHEGFPE